MKFELGADLAAARVTVKLYGTKSCHLCEEAAKILHELGITAINIDIADNDNLFEIYSLRIPVMKRFDNGAELDWPFDAAAVSRFMI